MGATYLTDMADVLRSVGVTVVEVPGWQTRARSSGGYDVLEGISIHHTAESPAMDGWPSVDYQTFRHIYKPLCNLYVDRKGTWWVEAGGATNTSGAGGPLGNIPLDSANSRTIGIEIGNNGVGEPYPEAQQVAVLKGVAALWGHYGTKWNWGLGRERIFSHFEWAPSRKIDPSGASRWAAGYAKWDMDKFRSDVMTYYFEFIMPKPTTPPPPAPKVVKASAWYSARPESNARRVATRVYGNPLKASVIRKANPGKWTAKQKLKVPGRSGLETKMMKGEGPIGVLRRMKIVPSDKNVAIFMRWNGGKNRTFLPGDPVFMPNDR